MRKFYQQPNSQIFWLCFLSLPLTAVLALGSPTIGQEIQLGDDINIDLDEDETELKPSVSTDGDRLNIQVEEQPKPETKIKFGDGGVGVRREREPAEERLDLSLPLGE
ncbi:MAG: hypothetical protein AAF383_24370 [Cyanobacteria bacterium P01_A01_bin.83]